MTALLFSFKGRTGRMPYLGGFVLNFLVLLVLFVGIMVATSDPNIPAADWQPTAGAAIFMILSVMVVYYSWFCLTIKRLHDVGLSGWLSLVILLPTIGMIASIILVFVPGQDKVNRFGPNPESLDLTIEAQAPSRT